MAETKELQRFWCPGVRGPLPGKASEVDVFEKTLRRYSGWPGWWVSPAGEI
jgi:hypothetical protein